MISVSMKRSWSLGVSIVFLASGALLGQNADIPLNNWTVPPYTASSSGGIHTMTDVTNGLPFVGVQPCRVADTRGNGAPITGGVFTASEARNWTVAGVCGIPGFVQAISVNITVVAALGIPNGSFLLAWPTGNPPVTTTAIITFGPGQILSNAAIIPVSGGGQITVNVSASTHVIMDVNGYFPVVFNNGTSVDMEGNVAGGNMMFVGNFATGGVSTHGIYGLVGNLNTNSAGVLGRDGFVGPADGYFSAGVRGEGKSGVLGISGNFLGGGEAVSASLVDGFGHEIRYAGLATSFGVDPGSGAAPWAVFGGGDIGATGTKHFLDPHPTNPKLAIGYISLEGPEAGTYFRGRAKFQNGMARIPVPEHFRFVTDPEGLTVQITPIGGMASFAVMKMDLNEIVVQASRNVEFSYLVQGVRATFKDVNPIRSAGDFMPRSAEARMPLWLSPAQQKLLIRNGTYREDGTVNAETAQRLGWDKIWEGRKHPAPQTSQP
jgi:hypothetical protein